jgi:hypothetical protein
MKISRLAAATLVSATTAGVVFTAMPFAEASPSLAAHRVARHALHHAAPAHRAVTSARATEPAKPRASTHPATQHAASSGQAAAAQAPAQPPAPAPAPTQPATTSQPLTAGMSSFEQCVAWHESGDNPTASSAGLFGILPATWAQLGYSGTAGQASVALQKVAFQRLYAELGTSPWAPYDGC